MKILYSTLLAISLTASAPSHSYEEMGGTTAFLSAETLSAKEASLIKTIKKMGETIPSNLTDIEFVLQKPQQGNTKLFQYYLKKCLPKKNTAPKTNKWIYYEPFILFRWVLYYTVYILEETSDGKEIVLQKTISFIKGTY